MSFWIILLLILVGFFVGFAFGGLLFSKSIESVSQKHTDAVKHITRSYDERARRSREANKSVLNYMTGGALGVGVSEGADDSVEEVLDADEDFNVEDSAEEVGDESIDGSRDEAIDEQAEGTSENAEVVVDDEVDSNLVDDSEVERVAADSPASELQGEDVTGKGSNEGYSEEVVEGSEKETVDVFDSAIPEDEVSLRDSTIKEKIEEDGYDEKDVFDAPVVTIDDPDVAPAEDKGETTDTVHEIGLDDSSEKLSDDTRDERDESVQDEGTSESIILIPFKQHAAESENPRIDEEQAPVDKEKNLIDGTDDEFESLSKGFDFEEDESANSVFSVETTEIVDENDAPEPTVTNEVENTEHSLIGSIDVESLIRTEIAKKFPASKVEPD